MVKTTAPKNKPKNPLNINPPMEPIKTTGIGTGAFLPNKIGFKILSDIIMMTNQIDNKIAVVESETANI